MYLAEIYNISMFIVSWNCWFFSQSVLKSILYSILNLFWNWDKFNDARRFNWLHFTSNSQYWFLIVSLTFIMYITYIISKLQVQLSKLYGPQGTFSFTSYLSGEHFICLQSNSTRLMALAGSKLVGDFLNIYCLNSIHCLQTAEITK